MNERVKKLWTESLTSGEFKQGFGNMRHLGKHCCLGVLQEVALRNGAAFDPEWDSTSMLPPAAAVWAGLDQDTAFELANANDGTLDDGTRDDRFACSFEQIAMLIKEL